jgi:hypothetical protein
LIGVNPYLAFIREIPWPFWCGQQWGVDVLSDS